MGSGGSRGAGEGGRVAGTFAIAQKYKLVAVPLYDLYENQARYGASLASIPLLLARLQPVCA